jgi:putative transcriptional regulator
LGVNFMMLPRENNGAMDALLASYAAGTLSRPLHALVASHLSIKPDSHMFVGSMEALLADEMEQSTNNVVSKVPQQRDARLAMIFDDEATSPVQVDRPFNMVPAPLSDYLDRDYADLPWKSVLPGLREVVLEAGPGREASMLWIKAGRAMPSHTHPGIEATLVLQGSFSDALGHYERGDIAIVDSDVDHKPVAGSEEDCICFAVSEGPVRLTGPIARLYNRLKWN